MKAFSKYHPYVLLAYFISVIGFTMFFTHPVFLFISLINSIILASLAASSHSIIKSLLYSLPMFLLISITNPLFSHDGLTVILFINDKPITLESIIYGFAIATMLISVIYWFNALNQVLTSDKIIFLFGRVIPAIALTISMTLGLIPKAKNQIFKIKNAQMAMGMDSSTGSIIQRVKSGTRTISILITWMLENGVDTADSMRARGYGLTGRSTYSNYKFTKRDTIALSIILLLSAVIITLYVNGVNKFYYYPIIKDIDKSLLSLISYLAFFILTTIPMIIEIKEIFVWRSFSKQI